MASLRRRKLLVCFYCNKRSDIPYDGFITQWECGKCDAVNYLDEHGEITDPQVATEDAAPVEVRYAIPQPDSPPSSQASESARFCSTCQKNQRLFTASLAQYDVETDPTHPEYREKERQYFKFRKGLEKRYPQVCDDCQPGVLEGMKQASKTAKTDWLGKKLEKTRARSSTRNKMSLSDCIHKGGELLWYAGLLGQLVSNAMALVAISRYNKPGAFDFLPPFLLVFLEAFIHVSTLRTWAWSVLICTFVSSWWNPKFKQVNNGFMRHIKGLGVWYKLQLLVVFARSLFYYIMGSSIFGDPLSSVSAGAHLFCGGLNVLLATIAYRAVKEDLSPLWAPTPGSLLHKNPSSRTPSPVQEVGSMGAALDEIAVTPSRSYNQPSPPPPQTPTYGAQIYAENRVRPQPLPSRQPPTPRGLQLPPRTTPSLTAMTEAESVHFVKTGELPVRHQTRYNLNEMEEMEWSPTRTQSEHRAFNPPRSLQRQTQNFGEAPVRDNPSPFWFKVPPAPITPAHRLRNPPNQPRLRVVSQESKQNFFNNINHRKSGADATATRVVENSMELAQQRFFPPEPPAEAANTLVDLMAGFSLGNEAESVRPVEPKFNIRSCAFWLLIAGLVTWGLWQSQMDSWG